jgi:hypothetical protein
MSYTNNVVLDTTAFQKTFAIHLNVIRKQNSMVVIFLPLRMNMKNIPINEVFSYI